MTRFLICENPKCRFILDSHIDGHSVSGAQLIVKNCPVCGGGWSSTCPSCGQALAVKVLGGLPHTHCCERKPHAKARAA
jgi:hypothetical protein